MLQYGKMVLAEESCVKRSLLLVFLLLMAGGTVRGDHLRLIIMGDGSVRDKATRLTWERHRGSEPMTEEAAAHCKTLVPAGKNDWRLPTPEELLPLIQMGKTPPVEHVAFSDTRHALSTFWSATERGPDRALTINMRPGSQSTQRKGQVFDIRCVRQ